MAGSKGSKYYNIFLNYSLSLDHTELGNVLNSEKIKLLKLIHSSGSLTSAANEMGVSYRKAWGTINDIEKLLEFKLVCKHRGGVNGGETTLTEDGLKLIEAHEELRAEIDASIHRVSKKFFRSINQ